MTKDKREMSLAKIRESPSTKVILISFKAGSTGEFGRLRGGIVLISGAG